MATLVIILLPPSPTSPLLHAADKRPVTIGLVLDITMPSDTKDLETPAKCTADFCLIPIGTPTASVSAQIADVQRLVKASGLKYSMHSAGTTVGELIKGCIEIQGSLHLLNRSEISSKRKKGPDK